MWLRMNKTVSTDHGYYAKGIRYDLPETTVNNLPKGSFEETCAPWNDNVDFSAIMKAKVSTEIENIHQAIACIEKHIEYLQAKLTTEISTTTALQEKASGLKTDLDTKTDKYNTTIKDTGKNAQKRANKLIIEIHQVRREFTESDLHRQWHGGTVNVLLAEIELKRLDIEDKKKELKNYEIEKTKLSLQEGSARTEGNEIAEGSPVPAVEG